MAVGQIDHVAQGLGFVPEKLRGERIQRYLAVYLQQYNDTEQAVQDLIDAFLNWETIGNAYDFVLETIGALLGQPRPDGFTDEQYAFVLQARARSRRSEATRADVERVAKFLARGGTVKVFPLVPRNMLVVFVDLQATDAEKAVYEQILLDTIGDVDGLSVQYVSTGTAFYDFGEYDSELYAP